MTIVWQIGLFSSTEILLRDSNISEILLWNSNIFGKLRNIFYLTDTTFCTIAHKHYNMLLLFRVLHYIPSLLAFIYIPPGKMWIVSILIRLFSINSFPWVYSLNIFEFLQTFVNAVLWPYAVLSIACYCGINDYLLELFQ